jgi:exosortase/archaeosortase family protein
MIKLKLSHKKGIIIGATLLTFLSLVLYFFRETALFHFITQPFDVYLQLVLLLISGIHNLFGGNIHLNGFLVYVNQLPPLPFEIKYLMKKWLIVLILFFWISPTTIQKKIIASMLFILYHFAVISLKISNIILLYKMNFSLLDAESVSQSISILLFFMVIPYWIHKNPRIMDKIAVATSTRHIYIVKKFRILTYIVYGFISVQLILGIFQFEPWIKIIFTTTQHVLHWFGYDSTVEPFFLIGEKGNIYMAKGCLGIKTTYIFVSFIFLTGEKFKPIILYSVIGIIIVNIVNIFRFVFLFIHIQNHGQYLWNMEVHDLFNVLLYTLIFLMWIIWLEWFTDIWPYLKLTREEKQELKKRDKTV